MAQTRDIPTSVNLPGKLTFVRRNETLAPVRNPQTTIYKKYINQSIHHDCLFNKSFSIPNIGASTAMETTYAAI